MVRMSVVDVVLLFTIFSLVLTAAVLCRKPWHRLLVVLGLIATYWGAQQIIREQMAARYQGEQESLRLDSFLGRNDRWRGGRTVAEEKELAENGALVTLVVGLAALAIAPIPRQVDAKDPSVMPTQSADDDGRPAGVRVRRGPALLLTAILTAVWTLVVICRPPDGRAGIPFAWRDFDHVRWTRHDLLALDIALWFGVFYATVRGFLAMIGSRHRQPFRRP
jgi:hypothetical protein